MARTVRYGKRVSLTAFSILSIISLFALIKTNLDVERVALARWTQMISTDRDFVQTVESHCSLIVGEEQSDSEAAFLRAVNLTKSLPNINRCDLRVASKHISRLGVRSFWNFTIHLKNQAGFVFQKSFAISFPLIVALFPLLVWALALSFGIRWSFVGALAAYCFFSAAFNPASLSALVIQSSQRMLVTEKHFLSLCCLYFWSLLIKHSVPKKLVFWPKTLGAALGTWNPVSLAGVFPIQYSRLNIEVGWIEPILCTTLSAYFLVPQWDSVQVLINALTLPRYFTLAVVLFLGVRYIRSHEKSQQPVCMWLIARSLAGIAAIETLAQFVPAISKIDIFLRITLAINTALLITPRRYKWKAIGEGCLVLRWLTLGLFVSTFTVHTGMGDVLLEFCNPRYHPNSVVLYTFFAGLLMGAITGNFSYSFFQILPLLARYHSDPLVQAALIDGVTAGTLLSPFHPITLITFGYFENVVGKTYSARIRLLMPALTVGIIVYSISSLKGISILQPITFVFLCLVFTALKLKEHRWSFA